MQFTSDIDIDFSNRILLLNHIKHIPAAMRKVTPVRKHATGVYVTEIPYDAVNDMAAIDYSEAENRGYLKLDLLNVHVYNAVRDEEHLIDLMREPDWEKFKDKKFVEKLIHISNHYNTLKRMPEPINSIPKLAMFLALIRPGKKHLIGQPWHEVEKTIWDKGQDGYQYKRAHALSYAHLVVVHANLLNDHYRLTGCYDLGQVEVTSGKSFD